MTVLSCDARQANHQAPGSDGVKQDTLANTASPQPSPNEKPPVIRDLNIVPVTVKEEYKKIACEVDITYPEISDARTSPQRQFNRYVQNFISEDLRSFKYFCANHKKYSNGQIRDANYFLGTKYEVLFANKDLLSVKLIQESFTGYVNADWTPIGINFDLQHGKLLRLADLFIPKSRYLKTISEFCIRELEKSDLSCSGGRQPNESIMLDQMRKGAAAKPENYEHWNLIENGIRVSFGEYQIGAGCLGLITVDVPAEVLEEKISARSPLKSVNN